MDNADNMTTPFGFECVECGYTEMQPQRSNQYFKAGTYPAILPIEY